MVSLLPLDVRGASVRKGGAVLLDNIDLTLSGGGATIVIGPNGSGKTTLLRLLHGLERARGGTVTWSCDPTLAQPAQAFVFQTPIILRRSVLENVIYPLTTRGVARKAALERGQVWLDKVGLADTADMRATRISGGEKQKLALARALITEPSVVFLDEPCSSLDGAATKDIEATLKAAVSGGTRVIMSTHDLGQARRRANEGVLMVKGLILEHNAAADFFRTPETPECAAFLKGDIIA